VSFLYQRPTQIYPEIQIQQSIQICLRPILGEIVVEPIPPSDQQPPLFNRRARRAIFKPAITQKDNLESNPATFDETMLRLTDNTG
jgi:hypothetical protein